MDESERCAGCGMPWTRVEDVWEPEHGMWSCACREHEHPVENEKRQHRIGRHHYRAWTQADAARVVERAAREAVYR